MRLTTALVLVLGAVCATGCKDDAADGKSAEDGKEGKDDGKDDGKADGEDGGKDDADEHGAADADEGAEGGKAEGGATPTQAADVPEGAVTDCPKELKGRETVTRVITKECGTVNVVGKYTIEGGTLILEAGATLAFKEGTELQVGYGDTGKLIVRGTKEAPVTFTTSGDKAAGVWKGITLYNKAARSSIEGAVIEWAGKGGPALLVDAEDVKVQGTTFRGTKKHAVEIGKKATLDGFGGNTFEDVGDQAIKTTPKAAGGIGADNTFPEGAKVQVEGGAVAEDLTWADIGVPWHVTGKVRIKGESGNRATLTIAEGNDLHFDGDANFEIGYGGEGTVIARGSAAKPIVFDSDERQEAGSWPGVMVYGKGEAELEHVELKHGGKRENDGTVLLDSEGRLTLKNAKFTGCKVGLVVRGKKADLREADALSFSDTPVAMKMAARYAGSLGGANKYDGDPVIELSGDKLEKDMAWKVQPGAKVQLHGTLSVAGGRLTVDPGTTLEVKDGVGIDVGYGATGSVELKGTDAKKIQLVGMRDDAGAWRSIIFYNKAHNSTIEHVTVRNAGGKAALEFHRDASAKISNLTCQKCAAPALTWDCKSSVEQTDVVAEEGTPSGAAAPSGC